MEITQKPRVTPKDFFFYFGAMVTLYWSAISFIALLFAIVDSVFRDELQYFVDPYSSGIRFAIASLIVLFPLSLFLFARLKKDAMQHTEKFSLPLRRWLYAITIFVTAVALIVDLVMLVNGFLGGDLTTRFVLKALSVFLVAGAVFWFCLLEIRVRSEAPVGVRKSFLIGAGALVLLSIVYGFVVMGSPGEMRKLRFDDRRTGDLQTIQWQVVNFWQQKGAMPKTLADLEDPISGYRNPMDPSTKEPYEFTPKVGGAFSLCATFELASSESVMNEAKYYPQPGGIAENWEHEAGRTCFERTIDSDLYPVRPKGI